MSIVQDLSKRHGVSRTLYQEAGNMRKEPHRAKHWLSMRLPWCMYRGLRLFVSRSRGGGIFFSRLGLRHSGCGFCCPPAESFIGLSRFRHHSVRPPERSFWSRSFCVLAAACAARRALASGPGFRGSRHYGRAPFGRVCVCISFHCPATRPLRGDSFQGVYSFGIAQPLREMAVNSSMCPVVRRAAS